MMYIIVIVCQISAEKQNNRTPDRQVGHIESRPIALVRRALCRRVQASGLRAGLLPETKMLQNRAIEILSQCLTEILSTPETM